jgi:16S rRNA processing protein RimM
MNHGILSSGWLPLAQLMRPQGRRGELLAQPLSDLPGLFAAGTATRLAAGTSSTPESTSELLRIEDHWFPTGKNAGRIVLKLSGCDSIDAAEALAGRQLLIPSAAMPALDSDTFFVADLVGCTLFDGDIPVGTITGLEFPTGPDGRTRLEDAAPLLAVSGVPPGDASSQTEAAEPMLVPFVRAWLESVDVPARRITMHLPEGLLDPANP